MSTLDEPTPPSRWQALRARLHHRASGELGRSAIAVFGFGIVNMAVGLVLALVLTATIGIAGFGIYALGVGVAYITAQLLGWGQNVLLIRLTATARATADWTLMRSSRRFVVWLYALGAVATYLVLLGVWLLMPATDKDQTLMAGLLGGAIAPIIAAHNAAGGILRGLMKIGRASLLEEIAVPLGTLLCALALLAMGRLEPIALLMAHGAVWLIAASLAALWVWRSWPAEAQGTPLELAPRSWLRAGALLVASALVVILFGRLEAVALALFTGAEAMGLYMLAIRLSNVMRLPRTAVAAALNPKAAELAARSDLPALSRQAVMAARYASLAALALGCTLLAGCALLAPRLSADLGALPAVMAVLIGGVIARTAMGDPVGLLNMLGHEHLTAKASVMTAILGTIALFALTWAFGIWGAALATALAYGAYTLSLTVLLARRFGVHCHVLGGR